jgi:hypothetical protein
MNKGFKVWISWKRAVKVATIEEARRLAGEIFNKTGIVVSITAF